MATPLHTPDASFTAKAVQDPAAARAPPDAVSTAEYLAVQVRSRTQLRVVLTEVAREERRTGQLSLKLREVRPSLQSYKAQANALHGPPRVVVGPCGAGGLPVACPAQ